MHYRNIKSWSVKKNRTNIRVSDSRVHSGIVTAICGPHGSGKTSLLNAISGIEETRCWINIDSP
ncbi:AAA family ATPase [Corynebacterium kroppenstedtii]|uniref:AAA family ATPase n=1 Tax=Corynebacterium sp. PCR 32 TaxID=3351342 RepID=UPI0037504D47